MPESPSPSEPAWMVAAEAAYDAVQRARAAKEAEHTRQLREARIQSLQQHLRHVVETDLTHRSVEWHFDWPECLIDGYRFALHAHPDGGGEDFVLLKRCQHCHRCLQASNHINDRFNLVFEKRLGDFRPGPYACPEPEHCQPPF